jgi:hypothetical protein
MGTDASVLVQPLLLGAGVALQFLMRQFVAIKDRWYWLVALGLAVGVWIITSPTLIRADHWQYDIGMMLLWVGASIGTIRGGSSATDAIASKAIQSKPTLAGNIFFPKTNSLIISANVPARATVQPAAPPAPPTP